MSENQVETIIEQLRAHLGPAVRQPNATAANPLSSRIYRPQGGENRVAHWIEYCRARSAALRSNGGEAPSCVPRRCGGAVTAGSSPIICSQQERPCSTFLVPGKSRRRQSTRSRRYRVDDQTGNAVHATTFCYPDSRRASAPSENCLPQRHS
jgi:hypothetical protein